MKQEMMREFELLIELFGDLVSKVLIDEPLREIEELDITPAQVQTLLYLARHDACNVGDVSAGLKISYPAATKAIDRLVAKQLVHRQESVRDRRQSDLAITEAGLTLLERIRGERRNRLEAIATKMAGDDVKALQRGLRSFLTAAFMGDRDLISQICLKCGLECYDECIINQAHLALIGSAIARV